MLDSEWCGVELDGPDGSARSVAADPRDWVTFAGDLWEAEGLAMLLTCATDAIAVIDADAKLRFANPAAQRLVGHAPGALIGTTALDLIHPDDRADAAHALASVLDEPSTSTKVTVRLRHAEGQVRQAEVTAINLVDDPSVAGVVLNVRDITELVAARDAEEASERRFRELADGAADLIFRYRVAEPSGFDYVNRAAEAITGHTAVHLEAHPEVIQQLVDAEVLDMLFAADPTELGEQPIEFEVVRADGSTRWVQLRLNLHVDESGRVVHADGILRDLSQHKAAEQELTRLALHDDLTGLANRTLFVDRLDRALRRADRDPSSPAVLFCDIDGFKAVNDTRGHAVGDHVLRVLASRLVDAVRQGDSVARFGGDEFLVLCTDVADDAELAAVCDRIRQTSSAPISVDGVEVEVAMSVGSARAETGSTAAELIRLADASMYREKNGRTGPA